MAKGRCLGFVLFCLLKSKKNRKKDDVDIMKQAFTVINSLGWFLPAFLIPVLRKLAVLLGFLFGMQRCVLAKSMCFA